MDIDDDMYDPVDFIVLRLKEYSELVKNMDKFKTLAEEAEPLIAAGQKEIARLLAVEKAALKFLDCKGRYHTELNYKELAKACGRDK